MFTQYFMFTEYLPLIIIVLVIYFIIKRFRKRTTNLVLKSVLVQEKANDDLLVELVGRASGLMGFLLSLCGLRDTTMLRITKNEVEFKAGSLSGKNHSLMSLISLSGTHCGYNRSILMIILAILTGIFTLIGTFTVGQFPGTSNSIVVVLLVGVFFVFIWLLIYQFSKKIDITVQGRGGSYFGLSFSPSLIEGVRIDLDKANEIIALVNKYVIAAQTGKPITTLVTAGKTGAEFKADATEQDR